MLTSMRSRNLLKKVIRFLIHFDWEIMPNIVMRYRSAADQKVVAGRIYDL